MANFLLGDLPPNQQPIQEIGGTMINFNWSFVIRIAFVIFVFVLIPTVIIPATADLITSGIDAAGGTIRNIIDPISRGGEDRLKGLVKLCLYAIFFILAVKLFIRK